MPIPTWCNRKSIRTILRGSKRILICCPKGKWKITAKRCKVATRAIEVKPRGRGFGAFKVNEKDPGTMTAGEVNRELDRLDKESSKLTEEFIATGRGHERPSDRRGKTDSLTLRDNAVSRRQGDLRNEIELRYGPGAPSRFPAGRWKARR